MGTKCGLKRVTVPHVNLSPAVQFRCDSAENSELSSLSTANRLYTPKLVAQNEHKSTLAAPPKHET